MTVDVEPERANLHRHVFAVIRVNRAEDALTIARGLAPCDLAAIEITLTTPDAVEVIRQLAGEGVSRLAAGSVTTELQVRQAVEAGAEFIVSPHFDDDLVAATAKAGARSIPGALTPSEIAAASKMGVHAIKVFPIGAVGGASYVRFLLEPLPTLRLIPSGALDVRSARELIAAGAHGVCLGRPLWRQDEVQRGDSAGVTQFAAAALAA